MSSITMRQLLEAGVHFGHRTRYWNPKMDEFIFGERSRIHIINLEQTLPLLKDACNFAGKLAANGGRIRSSAPSALPARPSRKRPSAAACRSSPSAGWAAR